MHRRLLFKIEIIADVRATLTSGSVSLKCMCYQDRVLRRKSFDVDGARKGETSASTHLVDRKTHLHHRVDAPKGPTRGERYSTHSARNQQGLPLSVAQSLFRTSPNHQDPEFAPQVI
jgi:hypothetical protein